MPTHHSPALGFASQHLSVQFNNERGRPTISFRASPDDGSSHFEGCSSQRIVGRTGVSHASILHCPCPLCTSLRTSILCWTAICDAYSSGGCRKIVRRDGREREHRSGDARPSHT